MKRHKDRFNSQEIEIFKDTKRFHMQCQRMTDKQKQYWQRKPYDLEKEAKLNGAKGSN